MTGEPIRQGDVVLWPIEAIPPEALAAKPNERGHHVMAEGEATGHAHVLVAGEAVEVFRDAQEVYLNIMRTTDLVHDCPGKAVPDHAPLPIEPGLYQLVRQYETIHKAPRLVAD
jgi:hypothetical protein